MLDGPGHCTSNPQEWKKEKVETMQLEENLVSQPQIITEPEPEQETQEDGRHLVPLDIPDFLLPEAAEDENGG